MGDKFETKPKGPEGSNCSSRMSFLYMELVKVSLSPAFRDKLYMYLSKERALSMLITATQ